MAERRLGLRTPRHKPISFGLDLGLVKEEVPTGLLLGDASPVLGESPASFTRCKAYGLQITPLSGHGPNNLVVDSSRLGVTAIDESKL